MKRSGHLAFLGRKDQSYFDTSVKMRELDNVELVLNSPTFPESGTASVRARPTVKHYTPSESSQGFAVPTPRVPVLPPFNGPKINGAANGNPVTYDNVEEDVFVPPPPSMAPPPPPETFILPPPDFLGYLSTAELASLQPPAMPAPKAPVKGEKNQRVIHPPSVPPPKPPSTGSSSSAPSTPTSKPSPAKVPKHPTFAPPLPPSKGQPKNVKTPPPKPIRLSSMSNLDSPPQTPAPPPPAQTPTQSTFNPQNTAKLYHVSNASVLSGYEERDVKPKQMLLLEDSGSAKPVPMLVQLDGNVPRMTPTKPVRKENIPSVHPSEARLPETKNATYHKENLPSMASSQPAKDPTYHKDHPQSLPPTLEVATKTNSVSVSPKSESITPLQVPYQVPRKLHIGSRTPSTSEDAQGRLKPRLNLVLDHKLRNRTDGEIGISRDGPAASPLALLMAAKERDRFKGFVYHQNPTTTYNQRRRSIQTNSNPHSSILPRSVSTSSLFHHDQVQVSPTSVNLTHETKSATIAHMSSHPTSSRSAYASTEPASPVSDRLADVNPARLEEDKEVLDMPLLPPPPEFDDFDNMTEPPPSIRPPDPPLRKTPQANIPHAPVPKQDPIYVNVPQKTQFQTKPKADPSPLPSPRSPSQATLVSILQKKMLEMDHKIFPPVEADDSAKDWGAPLSDDTRVAVLPKTAPQAKKASDGVTQTKQQQRQEMPGRVVTTYEDTNSTGPHSSHQYGMTYRVRPGTKQPITLIRKGPP
uniref:uncharacterized protein C6orf132 homolog n=1 Tax=Doryrhamphus excisus TaxID=161450 RepID=UPI0025AD9CFC|nr:uncharacterized protein C6orf132 homolog [Doryrhamphus excisus]XP_057910245.1 uncharacterized protein C6orf132 homolog [Doryrhamphus excisus]XP_057910246.1 uncharacterized protein C6orf132 homolog [Doryrhamphus excisus]XP_057910247.1 uncharacterized protein C6orf132 homolog [Doryrhamphus excisus]